MQPNLMQPNLYSQSLVIPQSRSAGRRNLLLCAANAVRALLPKLFSRNAGPLAFSSLCAVHAKRMRTLTCLARSFSLHPVCKPKLRRTTVDGGRASLASSGPIRSGPYPGPSLPVLLEVGVGSVSPVPPRIAHPWREGVAGAIAKDSRLFFPWPRAAFSRDLRRRLKSQPWAEVQTLAILCFSSSVSQSGLKPYRRPTSHQPAACPQSLGCRRHGVPDSRGTF